MTQRALNRSFWPYLILVALNACTGVTVKEPVTPDRVAYQNRAEKLSLVSEWGLVGKISLDDGDRGGSGRLQWDVKSGGSALDFHGAMGRGAWHLQIGPEGAVLKEADGTEQTAAGVDALLQQRMGWPVPVDALQWWVRGLAAPGIVENEEIDSEGLLLSLDQFGWNVKFNRYDSVDGVELPKRLDANREKYRVKLAISRWRMDMGHGPGS